MKDKITAGRHSTKKRRTNINLTQFTHAKGIEHSNETEDRRLRVDFEIFAGKMRALRGWDEARSLQEWRVLELDPSTPRDNKGPPYSPLRLTIPAWMFGGGTSDVERAKTYETRSIATSSKADLPFATSSFVTEKQCARYKSMCFLPCTFGRASSVCAKMKSRSKVVPPHVQLLLFAPLHMTFPTVT